jgi:hypothetical protein
MLLHCCNLCLQDTVAALLLAHPHCSEGGCMDDLFTMTYSLHCCAEGMAAVLLAGASASSVGWLLVGAFFPAS